MARTLTVRRKGYRRKGYRRKDGTYVKPTYVPPTTYKVKDRGAPGRGPKVIEVKKGKLAPYHTSLPERKRHEILKKKIRRYGALSIYRALMAQVIFRKREHSRAKAVFKADAEWVKEKYGIGSKWRRRRRLQWQ